MRFLLFHCEKIGFKDTKKSNRPKEIDSKKIDEGYYYNVGAVFVCVEKWDRETDIQKGIQIIDEYQKLIKRNEIVLTPFAHLSNYIAEPQLALSIFDKIAAGLVYIGYNVRRTSFGYHKTLDLAITDLLTYGHPGSVAFRKIPEDMDSEIKNYFNEFLSQKNKNLYDLYNLLEDYL